MSAAMISAACPRAVRLDGDVDARALGRDVEHRAVVEHFEDVAAVLADGRGDAAEHAGPVADQEAHRDDRVRRGRARAP